MVCNFKINADTPREEKVQRIVLLLPLEYILISPSFLSRDLFMSLGDIKVIFVVVSFNMTNTLIHCKHVGSFHPIFSQRR